MIYNFPPADEPICQGDVFSKIPYCDLSLLKSSKVDADGQITEVTWPDVATTSPVHLVYATLPVTAIVVSHNCDIPRSTYLTLMEIHPFEEVENCPENTGLPKVIKIITRQSWVNRKWFYLPVDEQIGFSKRMAVDFRLPIRLSRTQLLEYRDYRIGRLKPCALNHLRERLAQFFVRHAFNEWYPLTREEFEEYCTDHGDSGPYSWQV
jgi:hypothetical protein